MKVISKVTPFGWRSFSEEELMELEPVLLRAILHERIHHSIEVPFYTIMLKRNRKPMPDFGLQAQVVMDVWNKRGLIEDAPDIQWAKGYIKLAEQIRNDQVFEWHEPLPTPFTDQEMAVVNKLIYGRRSMRNWINKPVPDELIERILEAGRAAPIGCNLGEIRFVVIKDHKEAKMVWSDISTENAVIIVVCYDTRIPSLLGQDQFVPQNTGFDAAAAVDHMLLMAHALGLGAVWLSKTVESPITKDTGLRFREQYGLPDYIEIAAHIAVGWPAIGTIKTKRVPLKDMILERNSGSFQSRAL